MTNKIVTKGIVCFMEDKCFPSVKGGSHAGFLVPPFPPGSNLPPVLDQGRHSDLLNSGEKGQ